MNRENQMNTPALETERLILRKFTEQDMEALFLILQDEEVNQIFALVSCEKHGRSEAVL